MPAPRIRQLVVGLGLLALGLASVASSSANAQDADLSMREAVAVSAWGELRGGQDTTGMMRATLDGQTVYLGDILIPLGQGSVAEVGVNPDPLTGEPRVSVELAAAAASAFSDVTAARIGQPLAIVLDGRVLAAPTILSRIPHGRVEISGVSLEESRELAAAIRRATGAWSLEDRLQRDRLAFRDSVDTSTPEGATRAYLRSIELADWLTTGRLLHSDAQALLREEVGGLLHLRADSVSLRDPERPYVEDPRQLGAHVGRTLAVADVLEGESPGDALDVFSDADAVTLLLALERGRGSGERQSAVIGVLAGEAEDDTVLVVVDVLSEDPFAPIGVSTTWVFELARTESGWQLLMPERGW